MLFFQYLCGFVALLKRVNKIYLKKVLTKPCDTCIVGSVNREEQQAPVGRWMLERVGYLSVRDETSSNL